METHNQTNFVFFSVSKCFSLLNALSNIYCEYDLSDYKGGVQGDWDTGDVSPGSSRVFIVISCYTSSTQPGINKENIQHSPHNLLTHFTLTEKAGIPSNVCQAGFQAKVKWLILNCILFAFQPWKLIWCFRNKYRKT